MRAENYNFHYYSCARCGGAAREKGCAAREATVTPPWVRGCAGRTVRGPERHGPVCPTPTLARGGGVGGGGGGLIKLPRKRDGPSLCGGAIKTMPTRAGGEAGVFFYCFLHGHKYT